MERLQKLISRAGICSRRKAEELITAGRVSVNGVVVTELGTKCEESDEIVVDGQKLEKEGKVVFLLNKPKGVVSTARDPQGRRTVVDLIDCEERIFPVGRLDFDSSGLLLMTNDGELMQKLIHPRFEINKTYEVTIDSLINEETIRKLEAGVVIEDYKAAPCKVEKIRENTNKKTSFLHVTIHEGKNREIRKMFETVGSKVIRLNRISEACLTLGDLKPGEYRRLSLHEIKKLYDFLDHSDN